MEVKHYNDGCENLSHQNLSYQGEKMDTFKIKAMLAAVRLGSLSKAAEEFNYTPSAFSHILTSLESELGVSLFVRSSSGVKLTEAGERLLPVFYAMEECEEKLFLNSKRAFRTCVWQTSHCYIFKHFQKPAF